LLTRKEGFEQIEKHDQERPDALDYYLNITGLSEDEFHTIMREKKLAKLEKISLPIHKKEKPNAERLLPFVEQIIQKHLNKPDPRVTRDLNEDN
jgi:hemerythrin